MRSCAAADSGWLVRLESDVSPEPSSAPTKPSDTTTTAPHTASTRPGRRVAYAASRLGPNRDPEAARSAGSFGGEIDIPAPDTCVGAARTARVRDADAGRELEPQDRPPFAGAKRVIDHTPVRQHGGLRLSVSAGVAIAVDRPRSISSPPRCRVAGQRDERAGHGARPAELQVPLRAGAGGLR